jgi:PAS domain S-box-containing protein
MPNRTRTRRATHSDAHLAILIAVAMVISMWTTLTVFVTHERDQVVDEVHQLSTLLTHVFADTVSRSIDSATLANANLADQLMLGLSPDSPEMHAALDQTLVNLPFLRGLGIVDAQGLVIGSTEAACVNQVIDLRALGPLPLADQEQLGAIVDARSLLDLVPSNSGRPKAPGTGFLPLIRAVQLRNGQQLYLVATINADAFATVQQATMSDPNAVAALASVEGRLITSTGGVTRAAGSSLSDLPPFQGQLPRREHGEWQGHGLREGAQIASFRALASRPLVAMVEFDLRDSMADWSGKTRGFIAAALVATLLIVGVTWIVVRSVLARMAARQQIDVAQRAVSQRERELSVTIRSLQELIFRTDANGAITFVNDHWMPVTGTSVAAAQGVRLWERVRPLDRDRLWSLFSVAPGLEARRAQASLVDETTGALRTFDFSVMPLQSDGEVTGFAGSAIDVTERVAAERQLETQLAFTRLVMEISPLPKSVISLSGRHLIVNKAWEDFTGQQSGDMACEVQGAAVPASLRALYEAQDRELLVPGQPQRYETIVTHRDGSLRDVVVNKVALHGPDGQASGILCVFMDVSEFRDAERATREARDAAEETSRAKSEFIANISHELRTPLQSIIGFSELGQMRARSDARLAAMFDDIHGAGQRMLTLVNDLLDVSKIDSTVGTIHLECTDLRGLVRDVVREIDPLISARHLHVVTELPDQPMLARVDPPRFQQVVRNVLANAIKFAPAHSRIDIVGDQTPSGDLRLVLRDQGPGIPGAELETIFEAFVQSSQTKDGSGGTGLGLAICRKIIDAHGGHIHAENLPERGAAFHIVLPARPSVAVDDGESESPSTAACSIEA